MTAAPEAPSRNGTDDLAGLRQAARQAYRDAIAAGRPISWAELGRRFGRSPRWGRDRVAEVHTATAEPAGPGRDWERPIRDNGTETREADDGRHVSIGHGNARPTRPDAEAASTRPPALAAPVTTAELPDQRRGTPTAGHAGSASTTRRRWVDTATILAVALVAAATSYGHMYEVAVMAGEPVWIARAFPITVDGLAVAAIRAGHRGRWWLALGLAASIAGNVAAQYPDLVATAAPLVSAWPPLALFGTHRLLHTLPTTATEDDRSQP